MTLGRATRRSIIAGIIGSIAVAASGQSIIGRPPALRQAGLRLFGAAAVATALPQTATMIARWSADDIVAANVAGGVLTDNVSLNSWTDSVGSIAAAPSSTAPKYRTGGQNGKPYVQFSGGFCNMTTSGANAVLTATQSTSSTVIVVYRNPTAANGVLASLVNANTSSIAYNMYANSTTIGRWGQTAFSIPLAATGGLETMGLVHRPAVSGLTATGRLYARGCSMGESGQGVMPGAATGFGIGGSSASGYAYIGEIYEVLVWSSALTSGEMKQAEKWIREKYNSPLPWAGSTYFRMFYGDSIMYGYGSANWVDQPGPLLAAQKGWPIGTYDLNAITGYTWTQMNTLATRDADTSIAQLGSVPIEIFAWEWANSGRVASTTYTQCQSFFSNRRTAGISRLVVGTSTDLSDGADTSGQRTERANYNLNIKTNWATFADAYVGLHDNTTGNSTLDTAATAVGIEGACPAAPPYGDYFGRTFGGANANSGTFTGSSVASGTNALTITSKTGTPIVGSYVSGNAGIPTGTYIIGVTDATHYTLSNNATAAVSGTLTFVTGDGTHPGSLGSAAIRDLMSPVML